MGKVNNPGPGDLIGVPFAENEKKLEYRNNLPVQQDIH
jgi:hypothetical protein